VRKRTKDHRSHDVVRISKFVDAELDAEAFLATSRDVSRCGECQQLAQEFRATTGLIKGRRNPVPVPTAVDRRIAHDVAARQGRLCRRPHFRGVPSVVATAAAAALLLMSSNYLRPPAPAGIVASTPQRDTPVAQVDSNRQVIRRLRLRSMMFGLAPTQAPSRPRELTGHSPSTVRAVPR
jgi:anti-sigma factor RsiW